MCNEPCLLAGTLSWLWAITPASVYAVTPKKKKPVGEHCVHPPFCQKDYTDARGCCMWTAGWHRYKDWQQEPVDFMWANTASSLGTVTLSTVQGTSPHGVWRLLPPKVIKNLFSESPQDTPLLKIISCITLNCFSVPISYTVDSSGLAVFI